MPKPEDKPEKKEEKPSEVTELEDGSLQVAVENGQEPQEEVVVDETPIQKEKPKPEVDPLKNKLWAQDRIISRLERQVEQLLKSTQQQVTPVQQSNLPVDDLDELAKKDWKAAVGKVADKSAREAVEAYKTQIAASQSQIETQQLIEKNSQAVLGKHPELNDDTTEKSEIFKEILNSNPRWRNSPDGPLLTMYAMEDELRKRGYDIGTPKKESEAERLKRVSASSLPSSKPVNDKGKVILTRDEKEFCDLNGISYQDFARTRSTKGGIEV